MFSEVLAASAVVAVASAASGQSCTVPFSPCHADIEPVGGNGTVGVTDLLAVINTWGQIGPPRPQGDCWPLPAGDCIVGTLDLLAVINQWGACLPTGSCWLPANTCAVLTQAQCASAGGTGWTQGADCADGDGDRIPNVYETNNCIFSPGPPYHGTNPNDPDTDDDGLRDGDEVYGTTSGLNLPAFGCNPCRRDILVETDWLYEPGSPVDHNKLHINQVARVVAAFNAAPVANPNGIAGIKLHIDYGQPPYGGGNSVQDPSGNDMIDNNTFGINGEFTTVKTANFAANRHGYVHYCLLHHRYSVNGIYQNSSGLAEIAGDDFIVTMSQWFSGDHPFQGNTFMHELGHNLNLRHGGNEDVNFKPNYNSVMNYNYQMCGTDQNFDVIPDNGLNYSTGVRIALNENSLNELAGVTGIGPAIDWNLNGNAGNNNVIRNINCRITDTYADSSCVNHMQGTEVCGAPAECYDLGCSILTDYNDWANVFLATLNDADLAEPEVMHCWIEDYDWRRNP